MSTDLKKSPPNSGKLQNQTTTYYLTLNLSMHYLAKYEFSTVALSRCYWIRKCENPLYNATVYQIC